MPPRDPVIHLETHEVTNQPPPLEAHNLFDADPTLKQAVDREGGPWGEARLSAFGGVAFERFKYVTRRCVTPGEYVGTG